METQMKEALFWTRQENSICCELCPHHCIIGEGKRGVCGVRQSKEGKLVSLNYGRIAGLAIDPIEKKPLYHFYPASKIFSVGTVGCNLHCPFCQNDTLSRFFDEYRGDETSLEWLSPPDLVNLVRQSGGIPALAYTYSEPVVWFEYVLESMRLCHEEGIMNVLVTNGFIEREPLKEWIPFVDAANVDLKAFRKSGYHKLGGQLEPVKRTIIQLFEAGVHIEITTLLVPGINTDLHEIEDLARWLASLSPEIPLHLSRYFPHYHYHEHSTDIVLMKEAQEVAKQHLWHVYLGNVLAESHTFCHNCGELLIRRHGYDVEIVGLEKGKCKRCLSPLWGRYAS